MNLFHWMSIRCLWIWLYHCQRNQLNKLLIAMLTIKQLHLIVMKTMTCFIESLLLQRGNQKNQSVSNLPSRISLVIANHPDVWSLVISHALTTRVWRQIMCKTVSYQLLTDNLRLPQTYHCLIGSSKDLELICEVQTVSKTLPACKAITATSKV